MNLAQYKTSRAFCDRKKSCDAGDRSFHAYQYGDIPRFSLDYSAGELFPRLFELILVAFPI